MIAFDVATWLDAPALDALPGDPVAVSADQNAATYSGVMDRIRAGVELVLDLNRDGQVNPGEPRLDR